MTEVAPGRLETTNRRERGSAVTVKRYRRAPALNSRHRAALGLLGPFVVLFIFVFALPIGYSIYESFFTARRSGLGFGGATVVFDGFGNYARVFSSAPFWSGVARVLEYGIVQVPIMLILALVIALLLDSATIRYRRFFRLAIFLPFGIPGVIGAILWSFFYLPGLSPIIPILQHMSIHIDFLGNKVVLWSIANIATWQYTGFNMIIIYASLQAIPKELYEAASVDGCSGARIAWHIKVPLVRPALILTAVFSIIGTLHLFNEPAVLSSITGSIDSKYTPNMLVLTEAIGTNHFHYASAVAVVLALATGIFSFGFLRLTRGKRL